MVHEKIIPPEHQFESHDRAYHWLVGQWQAHQDSRTRQQTHHTTGPAARGYTPKAVERQQVRSAYQTGKVPRDRALGLRTETREVEEPSLTLVSVEPLGLPVKSSWKEQNPALKILRIQTVFEGGDVTYRVLDESDKVLEQAPFSQGQVDLTTYAFRHVAKLSLDTTAEQLVVGSLSVANDMPVRQITQVSTNALVYDPTKMCFFEMLPE